ncbi:hypothetical protein ILYODFUR_036844 [Ilyodon furcidens]|uniref:Uncharacterized protein n=1 Tax=Ilyodon furcidens TaxID=33524 RepID=A0ABV0TED6_9TELE
MVLAKHCFLFLSRGKVCQMAVMLLRGLTKLFPGMSFCLCYRPGCGMLGLTVPVSCLRRPASQPQQIGHLSPTAFLPVGVHHHVQGLPKGTAALIATATGGSINNRDGVQSPLGLYVCNLSGKLVKAQGAEYIYGKGLRQMFPADPHYTHGPAKSVRLPPLPVDPTHHQVVIDGQLKTCG